MKKLYALILAGALLFIAVAVVTAQNSQTKAESDQTTQRAVFKVDNMTCGACLSKINAELEPLEGFTGMGANLLRKMVAVDFITPLTPEKIGLAITNLGYPATLDEVDVIGEKETFAYMQSQRGGSGYGSGGCCGGGSAAPARATECPNGGQTGSGCGLPQAAPSAQKTKDI